LEQKIRKITAPAKIQMQKFLTPSIPKNVILKFQNAKISSFSALKNLIAHQKIARVIALILMYHTPMLFPCLPSQNHAQRAENHPQFHKSTGKTIIMASTDVPDAPVTPQEVPRKLSQRDRDVALLFFLTMVVKADGRKLRNSIAVEAAQNFNTSRATEKRVWKKYKDQFF